MEEVDLVLEVESMVIPEYMKFIQELSPKLNQTQCRLIESTLNNLGVKHIDDLIMIEPTDLTEAMTVIQARKLCLAIKTRQEQFKGSSNSLESGESLFNSFSSAIETSTPECPSPPIPQSSESSTSSDSSIFCSQKRTADNPRSNWLMTYDIPYQKFSSKLTDSLNKNIRPSDTDRREMVRILVDDIQDFCKKPSSSDLAAIAMKIVKKHQPSLCDLLNGTVLGQGHTSLYQQLREKINNNNRKRHSDVDLNDTDNAVKKKQTTYVKYGCIEWQSLTNKENSEEMDLKKEQMKVEFSKTKQNTSLIDTLMNETYSCQREVINKSPPVAKIKAEYPYLFKKRYALIHFKRLTGQDMEEKYMLSKKMKETLINHFKSLKSHDPIQDLIQDLTSETEMQGNSCFLKSIPFMLMLYFEESDLIQVFQETSDVKLITSVIRSQTDKAPVICVVGKLHSSNIFHIFCEDILLTTLSDLDDAVMVCFSLYYILNLRYHTKGSITLEFIQRVFLGINPVKGTKSSKLKGKRSHIHPKVLSLSNKLNF